MAGSRLSPYTRKSIQQLPLLGKLRNADTKPEATDKAERSLAKVRDELEEEAQPNRSMIKNGDREELGQDAHSGSRSLRQ